MAAVAFPLLTLLGNLNRATLWTLGARRSSVRIGDRDIVVHTLGPADGEPWLLLHGLGSTALAWAPVLRHLRREVRMVVPELSELGGSTFPDGALGIRESAEVLAELCRRLLPGGPVTVAGISLGGWMAVRLALARPELVARLLLVNAGGYREQDWQSVEAQVRVATVDDVARLYDSLFVSVPWVFRLSRPAFLAAYTSRAVRSILDGTSEDDAFDDRDLARIECPAGLVWSAHDGLFPLEVAKRMAAALPRGHVDVIHRAGHAVHFERPAALLAAIDRFRVACPVARAAVPPAPGTGAPTPAVAGVRR